MFPCDPVFPAPGSGCVVFRKLNRAPFVCPPSAFVHPTIACTAPGDCAIPNLCNNDDAHELGEIGCVAGTHGIVTSPQDSTRPRTDHNLGIPYTPGPARPCSRSLDGSTMRAPAT